MMHNHSIIHTLNNTLPAVKNRIKFIISNQEKFFSLRGSDPRNRFGCCPSTEVEAANRLVEAGILESWRPETAGEGCPHTLYAFKGEITLKNNHPVFHIRPETRQHVLDLLARTASLKRRNTLLRWLLLVFIAVSFSYLLYEVFFTSGTAQNSGSEKTLINQLKSEHKDFLVLTLFRYTKRCHFCLSIETFSKKTINDYFPESAKNNKLVFTEIIVDDPANANLVKTLGIFTSSLVLSRYEHGQEKESHLIKEAWELVDSEKEFIAMLRQLIRQKGIAIIHE